MRVGMLGKIDELSSLADLGMRSIGWMRFAESVCGPGKDDWQAKARDIAAEAKTRDIRISAIGALYANPLDPKQTDHARVTFLRAIEVASEMGVKTVSGISGSGHSHDV